MDQKAVAFARHWAKRYVHTKHPHGLDDETSFRYDVVKACDSLALIGAAFSKRFGSDAYRLWADAMIKLGDRNERVQYKAADDIFEALVRTWADLRTWIFMKSAYKPTKPKSKSRKAKR